MPSVPLETIRGAKLGPNDHGCSCGQGDPAPTTGMAALPLPSPPGPDLGEDEELIAAHPETPGSGMQYAIARCRNILGSCRTRSEKP